MPRKPHFMLPGVPVRVVQRGHSRAPVFFEEDDYRVYLNWLGEAAEKYTCAIHAYVLMTNHVHILTTPEQKDSISRMMQYTNRYYVPYINYHYGTSGSIWEGRYKASLVQEEDYLLACMRYIELNPVRAQMVHHPRHYRWSSYRKNGEGKTDKHVTPHSIYKGLGHTDAARRTAYRALFKAHIDQDALDTIRSAWQTGTPLGNAHFKDKVAQKLQMKIGYAQRGRPKKPREEQNEM